MRIGMVLDNEVTGDNRVINEAKILSENGHQVFVLGLNFGKSLPHEKIGSFNVTRIKTKRLFKNLRFFLIHRTNHHQGFWKKHIESFAIQNNIEVIHAHDLYMVESCKAVSKKLSLKIVADLHENYPEAILNYEWTKSWFRNFIARPKKWATSEPVLLKECDGIICLGTEHKKILVEKYPNLNANRIICFENVPDLSVFSSADNYIPDFNLYNNSFRILYFGLISQRRGIETAIRAIQLLKDQEGSLNIQLVVCGNITKSEETYYKELFLNPTNKGFIDYKGWIELDQLAVLTRTCAAGISPIFSSKQHDIGVANKVYQYMACGLPIIVSDSKMQANVVSQTKTGLIYKSDNEIELANQIKTLFYSKELRKEYGMNGLKAVSQEYNINVKGLALLELYKDLTLIEI